MTRSAPAFSLLAVSVCIAAAFLAQTFRGGIDLVHLDVTVPDRDRRPVRGLTAEDFEVYEDGALRRSSVRRR
jgi:hypothetical protein